MDEYCKVLIVDDEFIMRQGMKHMLEWEKEGFQIVGEASNGQEGLVLVGKLQPHIILADIVMPVIDGIEFSEILSREYPSIQLIILSSYDKFEYVKTTLMNGAADYILKPTLSPESLQKALKKAVEKIPGFKLQTQREVPYSHQIEKVILGFTDQLDEEVFAKIFSHTWYRLLAIDLRVVCGKYKEEIEKMRYLIEEFYEGITMYTALPVFLEEGVLCMFINYRIKDEELVMEDAQNLGKTVQRLYQRPFFVLSRKFSNMQQIRSYYQQDIKEELHSAFYYFGDTFVAVEASREKVAVRRFEFETYTRHLSQSRYAEALHMFEVYMKYLWDNQVEEDRMKNLAKNLLYNYLMEIEKYAIESEDLKERFFDEIDSTLWLQEFQCKIQEISGEIRKILMQNVGMKDVRIKEIKKFVNQHYKESLELSDIAEKFNFNYNYLSSYFSQVTKEGFSEYLNKIRINRACELLKKRDMPISDVGSYVGYSEHSYFCRVFKKIIGETPSNYRRRWQQG